MPEAPASRLGRPERIAVLRALQLGDMLCAVPALRALRQGYPQARITLIGLPWAAAFASRFHHLVDDFMPFPGYPGLPECAFDPREVTNFLEAAQSRRFDVVVQMHGHGRIVNTLTQLLGPRRSAGFYLPGDYCPDPERYFPWEAGEHEIARWVRLLALLGIPSSGLHLEFPVDEDDWLAADMIANDHSLDPGRYVCLHPGSQLPSRRWQPAGFAAVGDSLFGKGYAIAITGTAGERDLAEQVAAAMRTPCTVLAGDTSLGALALLIGRAAGLVCNDTGVSHVAAAMRTPSTVVSCGSDPARWGPLNRSLHRVLSAPVPCRPCQHPTCPIGHPCSTAVSAQEVAAAMQELLRCRRASAFPLRVPAAARSAPHHEGMPT
jgi:ADP-heptose:LPS heptosyltransferase